jgi:hypothetical protein
MLTIAIKQQLSAATMRSFSAIQVLSMFRGMAGGLSSRDMRVPSTGGTCTEGVSAAALWFRLGVSKLLAPADSALSTAALWWLDMDRGCGEESPAALLLSPPSWFPGLAGRAVLACASKTASVVVVSTSVSSDRSRYSFSNYTTNTQHAQE